MEWSGDIYIYIHDACLTFGIGAGRRYHSVLIENYDQADVRGEKLVRIVCKSCIGSFSLDFCGFFFLRQR